MPSSGVERRLLLKIDWFILSYCCLMYFTNYLDRSNVNNAYVSDMKQDSRFFLGMAEASTFVGTRYILGSWYKPSELGKRSGSFTASGLIGTLFSGLLQGAVYKNLGGVAGRSGWRWLFVIDGVITLPIALYGFLVFPDVPATTKAFYLTEEERLLLYERLKSDHDVDRHPLSWGLVKKVLGHWRWYACSLLFAVSGETESFSSNNLMGQWLSSSGDYSVEQVGMSKIRTQRATAPKPLASRLLPLGCDGFRYRFDIDMCDLDGLRSRTMARVLVHVFLLHCRCRMHPDLGQSYRG